MSIFIPQRVLNTCNSFCSQSLTADTMKLFTQPLLRRGKRTRLLSKPLDVADVGTKTFNNQHVPIELLKEFWLLICSRVSVIPFIFLHKVQRSDWVLSNVLRIRIFIFVVSAFRWLTEAQILHISRTMCNSYAIFRANVGWISEAQLGRYLDFLPSTS